MIHTVEGDLFDNREAEVYINPVNCEGVMGKGIAKEFKHRYPDMFWRYKTHCDQGLMHPGSVVVWKDLRVGRQPEYIFNLATKDRWRNVSRWEWIYDGLSQTVFLMRDMGLHKLAMPALGCGEGRLDWPAVQKAIYDLLSYPCQQHNIEIWLYKPIDRG